MFERMQIQLHPKYYSGRQFEIQVTGDPRANPYVQSASMNGESIADCWIPWDRVRSGGTLELSVGPEPAKTWGVPR
jgi:putative alpha-1,2-mannosidase